jgi:fructose-bisphosphate aldolase class 1
MNTVGLTEQQLQKMKTQPGFIAALDQSGGSTPKALAAYGIKEGAWSNEAEMFAIVHQMRTRIITSPSFTGERILAAILFENTMDREIEGQPTADYLWNVKRVVPFLKVDKGLADEKDGVHLMKSMPQLAVLPRVVALSGGYSREEGNERLRRNHGVVASFSRALLEGLSAQQSDAEFNALLDAGIRSIFEASTVKQAIRKLQPSAAR